MNNEKRELTASEGIEQSLTLETKRIKRPDKEI